jgi:CheY-like chemotaxis protein
VEFAKTIHSSGNDLLMLINDILDLSKIESGTVVVDRQPDAITLDIRLPDMEGWRVLEGLKRDLSTRHIPVWVITTEDERERALTAGAAGVLTKPLQQREALEAVLDTLVRLVERPRRTLWVLGRDEGSRDGLMALLTDPGLTLHGVTRTEGLPGESAGAPDAVVLDVEASEVAARRFDDAVDGGSAPVPLVVYAPEGVPKKRERTLKRLGRRVPLRVALSAERLVDETALALHRRVDALAEPQRELLRTLYASDSALQGRTALIVDDDIRNIFAMTSVLESHRMRVVPAETGREAIERLQAMPGIDIVLMDIMMPDMDGYDTMRAIRRLPAFRGLPIVAVTAKAMKGDREKCIEAGAWDYLPKPVDADHLLAVFRTWLHR